MLSAGALVLLTSSLSWAQDEFTEEEAPVEEPVEEPAPEPTMAADTSGNTSGNVGMGLPSGDTGADVATGDSEHSQMVGHLGIGYLGKQNVPVGVGAENIAAPVIGIRYWLDDFMGIDAGLGLAMSSGSGETTAGGVTTDGDLPSRTGFILHGGLPLSLLSEGHFSFQVVPELNLGFGSGTDPGAGGDTDHSGFVLEVGARAGGEIHFGFVDLPRLSLQAGVGLMLALESRSTDAGGAETSTSNTSIGTTVNDNPWNIFTSNISALYYF
jgi:hypothetical protein